MKKIILFASVIVLTLQTQAQKLQPVKNLLMLQKLDKAKEDFDNAMEKGKFDTDPEAYILKTAIYAGLATSEENKGKPEGEALLKEAKTAFLKYIQMDPTLEKANDPIYQNGPIALYSNYYSEGYNEYSKQEWQKAFEHLKFAVQVSDILRGLNVIKAPIDTNVLILAGVTAEKSNNADSAVSYYSRLANAKITDQGFENVYRYLVNYAINKGDLEMFDKYKKLGAELYPKSEYFTYDKVDFAVSLAKTFALKKKAIEEILAKEPDNFKANEVLGEIIFDTLNSDVEGAVKPANAAELEKLMVQSFNKAASLKENYEVPYLFLGNHFINQAADINDVRAAHISEVNGKLKPGQKPSPADNAVSDSLAIAYGVALEKAEAPYDKVAKILGERAKANNGLGIREKAQYKRAVNYLSKIYAYKKAMEKKDTALQAKYAAEQKKWDDLYDTINDIPTVNETN